MNGPKAEKIEQMFDSIAPDYDKLNHILSLGIDRTWRHRALKKIVTPDSPQRILDVACGTGDFSIAISKKASPETIVTGIDLSEGMLKVMREKIGNRLITTCQGNCESMPFDDNEFDVVTIAFGIRNFEHREVALKEILRVLKPGGRLVILELSMPSVPVFSTLYKFYFTHILPFIGGLISGDRSAYSYLPASVLRFPPKDVWMATMRECGYCRVSHKGFTAGICRLYVGEK